MPLYLCVDCGGSKASAVLADSTGNLVARALGGPSNYSYLGLAPFLAVVQETVEKALGDCDPAILRAELPDYGVGGVTLTLTLPPPPTHPLFAAAWLGISGCDSPAAITTLTPALEALLGVRPRVANDTHLLASPMVLYPEISGAIALVAGTGGIVVSFRDPRKSAQEHNGSAGAVALEELGRVGGWGWILGDEGGGFHVGREALRQVLDEADRGSVKPSRAEINGHQQNGQSGKVWGLKNRILQWFGVDDVYELLTIVHLPDPVAPVSVAPPTPAASPDLSVPLSASELPKTEDRINPVFLPREKRLSSLSPLVFAAAFEDGDSLALNVLKLTSGALVDQISILLKKVSDAPEQGSRTIYAKESILCMGGSLSGIQEYRNLILEELEKRGHVFSKVEVVNDAAAVGAKALALAAQHT